MCLGIPMKIIEKTNDKAQVESGGMKYDVSLSLVPEAKVNDYVIVHAGFAIQVMDKKEANKTLDLFKEIK